MELTQVPKERLLHDLSRLEYDPVKDRLGEGAYGVVYRAKFDGYEVAAKVVDRKKLALMGVNTADKDEFQSEARVMAALSHPLLVMMVAFYVDADKYIIVQELAKGGSLMGALHKNAEVVNSNEKKCKILKSLIHALRYLHQHSFIHRDIKAENVLLDEHGNAKLADFGLSKLLSTGLDDIIQSAAGTPWWRAPEMNLDGGYTQSADIFSLGMTVVELFTRVDGDDIRCSMIKDMKGLVEVLDAELLRGIFKQHCPSAPCELVHMAVAMCNPDPMKRPTLKQAQDTVDAVLARYAALEAEISACLVSELFVNEFDAEAAVELAKYLLSYALSLDSAFECPQEQLVDSLVDLIASIDPARKAEPHHTNFFAAWLDKRLSVCPGARASVGQVTHASVAVHNLRRIILTEPILQLWQQSFIEGLREPDSVTKLLTEKNDAGVVMFRFSLSQRIPLLVASFVADGKVVNLGIRVSALGFEIDGGAYESFQEVMQSPPLKHLKCIYPDRPLDEFTECLSSRLKISGNIEQSFM
eukprot:TRINITY_DN5717_c0_g1_i1.p1 TRINITY_DN5717_c0_g1~~TRINITY_DN5717_c0_g1_i1.p1  ORF type:complete len:528 (+),score=152.87 TRINITY_DN5717_c0_g1_i1:15-1598(+)